MLPSLPDIVGIVDQGGDGYGAAQAFAAAGKPRPTIIMGNRQDELQWWKEQKDKDGYTTWSASIAPGVSTLGLLGRPADPRRQQGHPARSAGALSRLHPGRFRGGLADHRRGQRRQPRIHTGRRDRGDQGQHEVIVAGRTLPASIARVTIDGGRCLRRSAAIVDLDGVEKHFGAVRALDGVDFAVERRRMRRPRRPQRRRQVDADARAGRHAARPTAGRIVIGGSVQSRLFGGARPEPRHPLRLPGTVALPESDASPRTPASFTASLQGLRLAAPGRRPDPRQARRDLSRPRHRRRRHRPRPVDRPAPDGRGGARLHRDRRSAATSSFSTSRPRRSTPTRPASCSPSCAASSPAASSCILISHLLGEMLDNSDRIVVMRDGKVVAADARRRLRPRQAGRGHGRRRTAQRRSARQAAHAHRGRAPLAGPGPARMRRPTAPSSSPMKARSSALPGSPATARRDLLLAIFSAATARHGRASR